MSTGLILGLALILGTYNIINKLLKLKEWDMKYNTHPIAERRIDKWDL